MLHRLPAGMAAVAVSLTLIAGLSFVMAADYADDGHDRRYNPPGGSYAPPGGSYAPDGNGVVPGAPYQPQAARPYPQGPAAPRRNQPPHTARRPQYQQTQQAVAQPAPDMVLCKNAVYIARVGSMVILYGEISAGVNEIIERNKDQIPADQIETQRKLLLKQRLMQKIETVLVYLDAKRTIPAEGFPQIEASLAEQFETVGVKDLMKRAKVATRAEMETKLQALGTSLEREKRNFMQNMLAKQWIREQINLDEEVTYSQMLNWYKRHLAEFEKPARARWEEIKVNFSNHSSKEEAFATIAAMGNRVRQGEALAQVVTGSDGTTASEGGRRDWINKGVLACKELDRALFGLPLGQLSPIIESPSSYYIIRVTGREDVTRTPFREAQPKIRDKIRQERTKKQLKAYIERLREQTPIWTVFDAEDKAAAELSRQKTPSRY